LQTLQRIDDEWRNLRVADDPNDTAHADSPRLPVENQRYLGMAGLPRKSHCISPRVTERFCTHAP
ncbi:hypothetical protein, partial [Mesorhizobium sp. B2-4-17]|uniref:hypothetical protein n=1 Tax=Mesorhizobium sp. B2-4-17 TaxID=2589932 RepID=UPI001AEDF070